ncbi:hypothetical protein [Nocardioides sp.]|uniref:hypothetical protein n=1 Tax=Nocardioides sp. TaxID=35761 RepID=UPI002ED4F027
MAHAAWAGAARELLIGTAGRYHQVITVKDLAAGAQERTHLTSTRRTHQWIGDVLDLVAAECAERGEPNLTSLCVNAEGGVGASYARSVTAATGQEPADPDAHAATTRLACYVHFDATGLPATGGVAVLTPKLSASRSRLRKAALDARAVDTCPRCYIELPAQGGCNNCD